MIYDRRTILCYWKLPYSCLLDEFRKYQIVSFLSYTERKLIDVFRKRTYPCSHFKALSRANENQSTADAAGTNRIETLFYRWVWIIFSFQINLTSDNEIFPSWFESYCSSNCFFTSLAFPCIVGTKQKACIMFISKFSHKKLNENCCKNFEWKQTEKQLLIFTNISLDRN